MKTIYHHTDHLSGTNIDTDETGAVVEMTDYFPFGEIRADQTTTAYRNPYKFTGKELDGDIGMYYYGARYYNPAIGRFASQDPWEGDLENPQTLNKYSYVMNNPLKYIDPTGKTFAERFGGFIGGLGDAGSSTLNAILHPIDTIYENVKHLSENSKYLIDYGQNHSASDFFSDLNEGVGIKVNEFNQMSEYDKGHVIGSVTEKIMEAAVVTKIINKGVGKSNKNNSNLSTNGLKLQKQLGSESQMGEKGTSIIGSPWLRDVQRLVNQYGGESSDWVKKSSTPFTAKDGMKFETHWYENTLDKQRVEYKTKLLK